MRSYTMGQLVRGAMNEALFHVNIGKENVLITRYGKAIAYIVPVEAVEPPLTDPTASITTKSKDT